MASGTSQTTSSSASDPTPATDFDICLSFHDDTRYKFTSYLYSALDRCGLKIFRNVEEQTIVHDSKFHVVVISNNYASSPQYLDQLVEIMNYHRTKQSRIIPIFYDIEASALENVTIISEKAVTTPFDADRLKNWRAALMGVREMSGYSASSKKLQADVICNVVDTVLSEINPKVQNITRYPVGLDSGVDQIIKKLLSSDKSQGVIKFGIYGMGGVGKTTLAKSLYNQLLQRSFEGSCFLENFREVLGTERGLECLQEKLINDVLNCKNIISIDNADQGFDLIRARICSRKVVIVIDDLDNAISLDFIVGPFASGSVVIITTRDEEVLDQADVEPMYRYMVNVLNDADSLTLFTKHAFGDATLNDTLMMLSRDIVCHAGGLPLALTVFGSYLSTQPSQIKLKEFLLKLESTDHNDSFELNFNDDEFRGTPSLSSSTPPHIKFDVFISFYGEDAGLNFTSHLYRALDGHGVRTFKGVNPELRDKDIISGSLLHDAIEYSQTYIVVLSKNYATSSWCLDELVDILNSHKRAERLIIPVFYKIDQSVVRRQTGSYQKAFEIHKTRFDMERVNKWRHALTQVSDIPGVHILENSYDVAMIDEIIDPILRLQVKTNALHVAEDLVGMDSAIENIMPSLSSLKNTIQKELLISLDAIELEDHMLKQLFLDIACFFVGRKKEEAVKILKTYYSFADYSIDILKKKCLLMLNNNDELMMHNLLQDMGREVARNKFPRDEPENHSRLWISKDISKVLTNQTGTEAIECIIHHDLNYLKYESKEVTLTTETSLSFTMETFTSMRRLRFLRLQGGTVGGNFTKTFGDLRWLHWDYCPLTYIPSEFYPQNIVILEFPRSKITKWESKMVFEMLKKIDMSYSVRLVSTPDFNMFPRLKTLYLQGCESLEELPDNLGNLTSLKKLNAGQLNVSRLPASIGNLSKLVELSLDHSYKLETLPDTICNLTALEVLSIDRCTNLKELPIELGNLDSLKVLSARSLSITGLPDSVGSLQKLVELYLSNSRELASLPDNICKLRALEILQIDACWSLKSLPMELGKIESLKVISSNDFCNSVTYLKHPDLRAETPSSYSGTTKYDVFLSFYGKDARYKFTSHLYAALTRHGIPTFMDNPELATGDVINDALAQAIYASKIYIVVFSENYAYSPWCLNELVEIYKCYENMKRMIIGVYCGIDPSVVRHQTGSFEAAFKKHEEGRYKDRKDLVNQWRTALTNVANLSGKSLPSQRSEADIIDEIIDEVMRKVNPKTLHVTKYPVGLDSVFKIVMPSLSSDKQEGVIKFGIYGMGGVGKTTLAKAIYNQLLQGKFNDSSFLADVSENSRPLNGLASLQEKLINDILKSKIYVHVHNVAQGIKMIDARICSTKILVVIDDLDDIKQFESLVRSFASGSVVIITTRDEQMLDYIKVEPRYRYKVNELDDAQSRTLFTKYAFEDATVNNSLMESYSEDILHLAGGLPLALEVFGSYLSTQQSDVGWQSYIDKLQRNPNSSITQKLMISLDAVALEDPMLKQLFLDIACLFIGSKKDEAVEILETYYIYYAGHNIDILKKRCLLTLNSNDELRMHDLLRDMGREVARNGFPHNQPENHSRLWMCEDISKVLTNKTATEAIECINHHDNVETYEYDMKTFKRMTKLRFLHLQGGTAKGNFTKTFGDLRWLHWDYCPLTYVSSGFHPQNIVILELRNSMITKWESKMVFKKLKKIDMSSSVHLVSTPDFNMFPCLETLHLQGCKSLKEFCIPVGSLKNLVSLNLCGCSSLKQLPDNLGNLTSLKKLNVENNENFKSLPGSICNLKALEFLYINSCTDLKELPKELGNMKSLKVLEARCLSITGLPDSVGSLQKLVQLYLSNSRKLARLPDNICQLRALEILHIDSCGSLESLPMELGQMKSLKVINAEFLNVKLPYTIGHLNKLVELKLYGNSELTTLPNTISNLSSLEILDLSLCKEVNILPDEIWELPSLRELVARGTTLLKKLPYIEPRQIPALPLMKLDVSSSGLTFLPVGFNHLSKLENLDLSGCSDLVSIPELPPNLESKLKNLNLCGCKSLEILPNVSDLKQLEYLDFTNCSGLMEIQGLEELTSLRRLHLVGCNLSLLGNTLTRRCFQLWSGFGHEIQIHTPSAYLLPAWITELPYGISGSSHEGFELLPNEPHNFLGIILCFKHIGDKLVYPNSVKNTKRKRLFDKLLGDELFNHTTYYSVKNTKSDFVWRSSFEFENNEAHIVVIPASIFSVRDDERIQVTANREIDGICLLYKTDEIEKVTPAPSQVTSAPSPLPIDSAPSPSSIESAPSPVAGPLSPSPPAQILSPPAPPSFESPAPTPSNDSNPAKSSPSPTVEKAAN